MRVLFLLAILFSPAAHAVDIQNVKKGECYGYLPFTVYGKLRKNVYEIRYNGYRAVLRTTRKLSEGQELNVLQYAGTTEVTKENGFSDTVPLWKECP